MTLFQKAEQYMIDCFEKTDNQGSIDHHKRVLYWIKKLKPDASEVLLTAAICHDIERAIYGDWKAGSTDSEKITKHQDLSAFEVGKFLEKEKIEKDKVNKIKNLIAHHQEKSDGDQGILCDADAITYLENSALRHARNYKEKGKTKEEIKDKIKYNFKRISSDGAAEIARKWYDEALEELNK